MAKEEPLLSVVVPVFNEASNLGSFHTGLVLNVEKVVDNSYEIIYCNDGSTDNSAEIIQNWHTKDNRIKLISFSRNFGKENALTAGIIAASGQAILTIDGDGQHPVELVEKFIKAWKAGSQVVIGVRSNSSGESWLKNTGSKAFYGLFNKFTGQKLLPGSTDFRLIDQVVRAEFLKLKEANRITRGLIDWLGFRREFIYFTAKPRDNGTPGYSHGKLFKLAADSFVSLSPAPLYWFGYLGIFITFISFILGAAVFIEQVIFNDPWHWNFTGTAMLSILVLFLVGIILLSQGILSLYISHIHSQTKDRPLYVIDHAHSAGIEKQT